MDATALLNTPLSNARAVMGADAVAVKRAFKALASRWHPDTCADAQAAQVFAHIVALRDAALGAPKRTSFSRTRRVFAFQDGRRTATEPLSILETDTGETLVGRKTLTFTFAPDWADLAQVAQARWADLRFADGKMEGAFAPLAPPKAPVLDGALDDGGYVLAMARPAGFVALPDLLVHLGGRLEPVHTAWLGSGLFNLVAWFQWMGLAHGAIAPETVFVNPETHGVAVLGGWEFATQLGQRPVALPSRTLRAIPRLEARGEVVNALTDVELVRDVLRVALGEPFQLRPRGADVPDAMAQAIASPPAPSAREAYARWIAALEAAWGPRRFRVLDTGEAKVYGAP